LRDRFLNPDGTEAESITNVAGNLSGGGLSAYSTMDVVVTLAPKTKRGANRDLEITFQMAI
jgi:hypothetical protein